MKKNRSFEFLRYSWHVWGDEKEAASAGGQNTYPILKLWAGEID